MEKTRTFANPALNPADELDALKARVAELNLLFERSLQILTPAVIEVDRRWLCDFADEEDGLQAICGPYPAMELDEGDIAICSSKPNGSVGMDYRRSPRNLWLIARPAREDPVYKTFYVVKREDHLRIGWKGHSECGVAAFRPYFQIGLESFGVNHGYAKKIMEAKGARIHTRQLTDSGLFD